MMADQCTLYLAESTIPNAGLGVFSTLPYQKKDILQVPQDILIQVGGKEEVSMGMLVDYYWETTSSSGHRLSFPEGPFHSDFISGFGACPNSDVSQENAEHITRVPESDRSARPCLGLDAYTPFHHVAINAIKDIESGSELFIDYGSNYFSSREGIYQEVPLFDDYKEAQRLMTLFLKSFGDSDSTSESEGSPDDEPLQGLWDVIINTANVRTQTAMPKVAEEVIKSQGKTFSLPKPIRSLEWLQTNGICLDKLEIKPSTIVEAGRGVFAKGAIEEGSIIVPAPVLQLNLNKQKTFPHQSQLEDPSSLPTHNLVTNYCFGHPNSTVLLCPYVTTALLINHSSGSSPNAVVRLSQHAYSKPELLQMPFNMIKFEPLGVMLEIVATRPIAEGEEIMIDYGAAWQEAWDDYKNEWETLVRPMISTTTSLEAGDAAAADVDAAKPILDCTVGYGDESSALDESEIPSCLSENAPEWLSQDPTMIKNANTTTTACFYYLPPSKQNQRNNAVLPWSYSSFDGKNTLGGLFPCKLIARQQTAADTCQDPSAADGKSCSSAHDSFASHIDTLYTALIAVDVFDARNRATIRQKEIVLVKNVPQSHVRLVSGEWMSLSHVDRRLDRKNGKEEEAQSEQQQPIAKVPRPFRHAIGLPEGIFPTMWMDLA
jgi:hypothetical protein